MGHDSQVAGIVLARFRRLSLGLLFVCFVNADAQQTNQRDMPGPANTGNGCPISPRVADYPARGPSVSNAWYANADRTIWATFWGWDFVRRGRDEPDSNTGYEPGQKVLWYKPTDYALNVTGKRIDGAAPPLVYDIARDPRPRGPIQPSRVYFPAPGCWEIDAKAGSSELRIVVLVKNATP